MNDKEECIREHSHKHENCCGHEHSHEHENCCGHEHSHEHQTMTIVTDENEELQCDVLGIFETNDKEYIALLPMGEEEVLIYRFISYDNNEEFKLLNIETDEEFEEVKDAFFDIFTEEPFDGGDSEN